MGDCSTRRPCTKAAADGPLKGILGYEEQPLAGDWRIVPPFLGPLWKASLTQEMCVPKGGGLCKKKEEVSGGHSVSLAFGEHRLCERQQIRHHRRAEHHGRGQETPQALRVVGINRPSRDVSSMAFTS